MSVIFDTELLACAEDYWRDMLTSQANKEIESYNTILNDKYTTIQDEKQRNLEIAEFHESNLRNSWHKKIKASIENNTIPAEFFAPSKGASGRSGWLCSKKEDGYCVILVRQNNKWLMQTRKGVNIYPPSDFLSGLEKSTDFPSVMVGELITDKLCLNPQMRNEQFLQLQKIWWNNKMQLDTSKASARDDDQNIKAWTGLRIKIFSFPRTRIGNIEQIPTIEQDYNENLKHFQTHIQNHPHIGMCRMKLVSNSPEEIIEVFESVVAQGHEGIVIVDPEMRYFDLNDQKGIFKLKQKIVVRAKSTCIGEQTKNDKKTLLYQTIINQKTVQFPDRVSRQIAHKHPRIKYMEEMNVESKLKNSYQLRNGFRHVHIAFNNDLSMEVQRKVSVDKGESNPVFNPTGWVKRGNPKGSGGQQCLTERLRNIAQQNNRARELGKRGSDDFDDDNSDRGDAAGSQGGHGRGGAAGGETASAEGGGGNGNPIPNALSLPSHPVPSHPVRDSASAEEHGGAAGSEGGHGRRSGRSQLRRSNAGVFTICPKCKRQVTDPDPRYKYGHHYMHKECSEQRQPETKGTCPECKMEVTDADLRYKDGNYYVHQQCYEQWIQRQETRKRKLPHERSSIYQNTIISNPYLVTWKEPLSRTFYKSLHISKM
jgi:hypothetical protein